MGVGVIVVRALRYDVLLTRPFLLEVILQIAGAVLTLLTLYEQLLLVLVGTIIKVLAGSAIDVSWLTSSNCCSHHFLVCIDTCLWPFDVDCQFLLGYIVSIISYLRVLKDWSHYLIEAFAILPVSKDFTAFVWESVVNFVSLLLHLSVFASVKEAFLHFFNRLSDWLVRIYYCICMYFVLQDIYVLIDETGWRFIYG